MAAKQLGVSHGSLGSYEREETLPDVDFLAKFADVTGADFNDLLRLRLASGKTAEARALAETLTSPEANRYPVADQVRLPLRVEESTAGYEIDALSEIYSLSFRREWLTKRGVEPHELVFFCMPDDAMSPTIRAGNLVVADGSSDLIKVDGLYALMFDGQIAVKRIQRDFNGGVWVRSDNTAYREQHVDQAQIADLFIVGKVIWAGGEV